MDDIDDQITKLEARCDEMQDKITSLESVKSSAKQESLIAELSSLMGTLVAKAETMTESTNQFHEFKQHQEAINIVMQRELEELKRQSGKSAKEAEYQAALQEIVSLRAQLMNSKTSAEKSNTELTRVRSELQKAISAMNRKTSEIRNLEAIVDKDKLEIKKLKNMLQKNVTEDDKEVEKVKTVLRKANEALQRKSEEIKKLNGKIVEYENIVESYQKSNSRI